jgi:hypothetical protein
MKIAGQGFLYIFADSQRKRERKREKPKIEPAPATTTTKPEISLIYGRRGGGQKQRNRALNIFLGEKLKREPREVAA